MWACVCTAQDEVLIAGFGRSGHAKGDIPGVRFKVRNSLAGMTLCAASRPASVTNVHCAYCRHSIACVVMVLVLRCCVATPGVEGVWRVSARSLQGEEGEAPLIPS